MPSRATIWRHTKETPEQRERRLAKARERERERRAAETPEQRERRLWKRRARERTKTRKAYAWRHGYPEPEPSTGERWAKPKHPHAHVGSGLWVIASDGIVYGPDGRPVDAEPELPPRPPLPGPQGPQGRTHSREW